jgi:hypothetical protein
MQRLTYKVNTMVICQQDVHELRSHIVVVHYRLALRRQLRIRPLVYGRRLLQQRLLGEL